MGRITLPLLPHQLTRRPHPHHQWSRHRPTTNPSLLSPSTDGGAESYTWPTTHKEGPTPLGSVNLMGGHGHQINLITLDVDGNRTEGLGGIGVKQNLSGMTQCPNFTNWLNHPNLIVCRHAGDQTRLGPDCRRQCVKIYQSIFLHPQVGHLKPIHLKITTRV